MHLMIAFPRWITSLDLAVDNFIQQHWRSDFLDAVFGFITRLGDEGLIWIALAILLLCFKKTRKAGVVIGIAMILGALLGNGFLKNLFERPRPFRTEGGLPYPGIVKMPGIHSYSFPSGHTTSSFAAAVSLFLCNKKLGIPALVLAALIAFSRLYVYVHFPTDILGGFILGTACAILAYLLWTKVLEKLVLKLWKKATTRKS